MSARDWPLTRCVITQKNTALIQAICIHNYVTAVDFFDLDVGQFYVLLIVHLGSVLANNQLKL